MRPARLHPSAAVAAARGTVVAVAAVLLATSACASGEDADSTDGQTADRAAATSERSRTSSSDSRDTSSGSQDTSSPTSPTPLPPVVSVSPGPSPTRDPGSLEGPYVASATWAESDYGSTLKVAPTPAGRQTTGVRDAAAAWREVLELAPDADTPGMWEQFDCHWTWARILEPDKPTWNVEPWRPVVDASQMIADGCNPGGPEV